MTTEERKQVLARLAGVEAASMAAKNIASTAGLDRMDGIYHAAIVLNDLNLTLDQVEAAYDAMITHLKEAELTINFEIPKLYRNWPVAKLLNAYQTNNAAPGYMANRTNAEERLFNYSNQQGKVANNKEETSVMGRLRQFGNQLSPSFEPGIRPRYAAINFKKQRGGAAYSYGHSYMVLKDHMKLNCTVTERDSLQYLTDNSLTAQNTSSKLANYVYMDRVIGNLNREKLRALYNAATGQNVKGAAGSSGSSYIEAQIHSQVLFNRDVKKIYISQAEMRGIDAKEFIVKWHLKQFAKINGIELEFIQ